MTDRACDAGTSLPSLLLWQMWGWYLNHACISPLPHRHYPSSPLLFLSGCPGQPAIFPGTVPAVCQGFTRSFLLSAEDSDIQSAGSEDQQVSLPCAIQAGEKVGPSNPPLTHQLLPRLHTACICPTGLQRGSPVPHTARPRQRICWLMGSMVEELAAQEPPLPAQPSPKLLPPPGQHCRESEEGGKPEGHAGQCPCLSTALALWPPNRAR